MELIDVVREPAAGGNVRLIGRVAYDDRPGQTEDYWFEVAREHADGLTESGNPWIACLAPVAAALGEPLLVSRPTDALLVRGLREIMAIWRSWFVEMQAVPLVVPDMREGANPGEGARRTGLFLSGGVDSLFSLYWNERADPGSLPADDVLALHGFDIPLERENEFQRHVRAIRDVAAAAGKTVVTVRTNVRQTRLRQVPWGKLAHGCVLAGAGFALEGRFRRLIIASANPYERLEPWGTHPLTDPLLSSQRTQVFHDGAAFMRWEKLGFLSGFDVAMSSLHVCFRDGSDANCGRCEKCLRNMIVLEVLGALGRCPAFPVRALDLETVSRILLKDEWQPPFYRHLQRFAVTRGRADVARAIERSLSRSRRARGLLRVDAALRGHRGLWRLGRLARRSALARAVS
jgi:hypothetical protein